MMYKLERLQRHAIRVLYNKKYVSIVSITALRFNAINSLV